MLLDASAARAGRAPLTAAWTFLFLALLSCAPESARDSETYVGEPAELGDGAIRTYVTVDADGNPVAIGARFDAAMVDDPPGEPDGSAPCFDVDGDGTADPRTECFIMHRRDLPLPRAAAEAAAPFQWLQFNWNIEGPPAPAPPAYADPHFDFHFFVVDIEKVEELRPGTCGFLLDCEAYERALIPVPERYTPADYISVDLAAAEEGDHLIDPTSPELGDPPAPFTRTFIYGSYEGHIIFYEPMISLAYLQSRPSGCFPLKLPEAWEVAGAYPTEYCIRYLADERQYTVSLERFVQREAG